MTKQWSSTSLNRYYVMNFITNLNNLQCNQNSRIKKKKNSRITRQRSPKQDEACIRER
jgi:hypothetical protein